MLSEDFLCFRGEESGIGLRGQTERTVRAEGRRGHAGKASWRRRAAAGPWDVRRVVSTIKDLILKHYSGELHLIALEVGFVIPPRRLENRAPVVEPQPASHSGELGVGSQPCASPAVPRRRGWSRGAEKLGAGGLWLCGLGGVLGRAGRSPETGGLPPWTLAGNTVSPGAGTVSSTWGKKVLIGSSLHCLQ